MSQDFQEKNYQEWLDSYWAKDIQELFKLEKRHAFQKFAELIFSQSGQLFEATRFSAPCEVTRPTIANYLDILNKTYVAHIVRPYSSRIATEITSTPKVYGFDTGFICYVKGWRELRQEDCGLLWEQLVLNELQGHLQAYQIFYWRDKQGHEIDFIYIRNKQYDKPISIECKCKARHFEPKNLLKFRKHYSHGENYVVTFDSTKKITRKINDLIVNFVSVEELISSILKP